MITRLMSVCAFVLTTVSGSFAGDAVPFHEAVSASEPILWYRFDEPVGTAAATNHGTLGPGFDGTFFNGVTLEAPSIAGDGSASFDFTLQQYVESMATAPASLTGNPTFTAEAVVRIDPAWFNPFNSYPPFLHWGAPNTGKSVYFSLWKNATNRAFAGFYNGGLRMSGSFDPGCWYHFVWTRDSARGTNGQYEGTTLYVNGVSVPLEVDDVLPGAPVIDVTSTTFRVQRATNLTRYFTGQVDEVVLYDRLLTPEEVQAHFDALELPVFGTEADLNGDGAVNGADLGLLLGAWGPCEECPADINCSGEVDGADLGLLLGQWTG